MAEIGSVIKEQAEASPFVWGTGRRKCAIARVRMKTGSGKVTINGKSPENYFTRSAQIISALAPLKVVQREGRYDIIATVNGGGIAGQADAVRLGIARALEKTDPTLRPVLKKAGYLSRDSRIKESKKYGQKRARKKFQFSKR